ncbi:MAG TPA: hypothetical protein VG095_01475 [Chthoniobacterales bacterium]|nr:hypothetical protein [Chthoniobacterales bacterium]
MPGVIAAPGAVGASPGWPGMVPPGAVVAGAPGAAGIPGAPGAAGIPGAPGAVVIPGAGAVVIPGAAGAAGSVGALIAGDPAGGGGGCVWPNEVSANTRELTVAIVSSFFIGVTGRCDDQPGEVR